MTNGRQFIFYKKSTVCQYSIFESLYALFRTRVLNDGGTFLEIDLPYTIDSEILLLTPNAYKVGKLYSAKPTNGTGDFTVDRNSTATYVGQDGLIKTALSNVPRIDWSTGEAVILRELQGINLIPYSEDFTGWLQAGAPNITPNFAISPDGTLNATKVEGDGTNGLYKIVLGLVPLTSYTKSIYVKYQSGAGTGILKDPQKTDIIIPFTATNEWVRHDLTEDTKAQGEAGGDGAGIWIDDIDGTILIWGAQLEQASTASSYIPTNGTTVTRLEDDISVPTPAGVTSITETIDGVEQTPITTIPATYSLPVGNINKVTML